MLVLLAGLRQPGLVVVTIEVLYKLNLTINGIPVGMHVEWAHKDRDHESLVVEIGILLGLFDYNYLTIGKVNEQNFGSGLATRLTCIPLPSTHFEMMDLDEEVDEESDNRLLEWAKKLDKTKGELSIKRIVRTMYDWTARRMADAKDNESKADEMLLKRCAYHGINYSAPNRILGTMMSNS